MKKTKHLPEITVKAVILGIVLSMILAGANAYLGLFAGMTASASIPAAVISMGIFRLFKKHNILENNIVQTAASAGESLAAGVIFTIPALILMGYWKTFDYWEIAKIAGIGGLIGVLFTIPLRRALIVEAKLKFPEGIATASVLRTGDSDDDSDKDTREGDLKTLIWGSIVGAIMKFGQQALALWGSSIETVQVMTVTRGQAALGRSIFGMGMDISPALLSVGFIVGRNIAILVFAGGLISWGFAIPIYTYFNPFDGNAMDAAWDIWNEKIRYLGVGAMVVGGIWSFIKLLKPLIIGIKASLNTYSSLNTNIEIKREEQDIPIKYVGIALAILIIPMYFMYLNVLQSNSIALIVTFIMVVFGFLFSSVAAYMAGVVGSSNNPISGVTIATILFSSLLLLALMGAGSMEGAAGSILIGAVVCAAASIGGDNMQDLKTGYLLGATPWKQQVMQIVGTISAALVLGFVLDILHTAYTIGSTDLPAPQATLMKSVAEGVFQGNLPWNFVIWGAVLGIVIILMDVFQERRGSDFRIPVLAVSVGIYLPIELSTPIFLGGMIAHYLKIVTQSDIVEKRGVLLSAGLITGEALMGIIVALPIFFTMDKEWWPNIAGFESLGLIFFALIIYWFISLRKMNHSTSTEQTL